MLKLKREHDAAVADALARVNDPVPTGVFKATYPVGTYIYRCGPKFLKNDEFEVIRQVVVKWEPHEYFIGESKDPRSWTTHGLRYPDVDDPEFSLTVEDAIREYFDFQVSLAQDQIGGLLEEIVEKEARIEWLKEFDRTNLEVVTHPDDWAPYEM